MKKKLDYIMSVILILFSVLMSVGYHAEPYYAEGIQKENAKKQREKKDENGAVPDDGTGAERTNLKGLVIVIDPGHGGFDPGKIGINDQLEKDLNLAISLKVRDRLEAAGARVIMTRETDRDLAGEGDTNKKKSDMRNRITAINEAGADLCISIHQNSYPSEKIKGAQVFYYSASEEGKKIAAFLQKSLIEKLADGNRRREKAEDSYFLLRKSECPAVIIECGFLSNWQEAMNLGDEYYQSRLAEAIREGLEQYTAGS